MISTTVIRQLLIQKIYILQKKSTVVAVHITIFPQCKILNITSSVSTLNIVINDFKLSKFYEKYVLADPDSGPQALHDATECSHPLPDDRSAVDSFRL